MARDGRKRETAGQILHAVADPEPALGLEPLGLTLTTGAKLRSLVSPEPGARIWGDFTDGQKRR